MLLKNVDIIFGVLNFKFKNATKESTWTEFIPLYNAILFLIVTQLQAFKSVFYSSTYLYFACQCVFVCLCSLNIKRVALNKPKILIQLTT